MPSAITAYKIYGGVIAVGVEVSPEEGEILDVDCTLVTLVGKRIVKEIAIGYKLSWGIEALVKNLERRYYGSARKALISAFRMIYEKYLVYKKGLPYEEMCEKTG